MTKINDKHKVANCVENNMAETKRHVTQQNWRQIVLLSSRAAFIFPRAFDYWSTSFFGLVLFHVRIFIYKLQDVLKRLRWYFEEWENYSIFYATHYRHCRPLKLRLAALSLAECLYSRKTQMEWKQSLNLSPLSYATSEGFCIQRQIMRDENFAVFQKLSTGVNGYHFPIYANACQYVSTLAV